MSIVLDGILCKNIAINKFCKKFQLRYLTKFWISLYQAILFMAGKELNLTKFAIKVTLKIDILVEFEICLCFSLLFLSIFLFRWIFNYLIINVIDDILLIRYPYCFSKICKESSNRKLQNFRDTQCAPNMKRLGKKKMKTVRCPLL